MFKIVLFRFEMLKSYHQVLNADTEGKKNFHSDLPDGHGDNYSDVDDDDDDDDDSVDSLWTALTCVQPATRKKLQ